MLKLKCLYNFKAYLSSMSKLSMVAIFLLVALMVPFISESACGSDEESEMLESPESELTDSFVTFTYNDGSKEVITFLKSRNVYSTVTGPDGALSYKMYFLFDCHGIPTNVKVDNAKGFLSATISLNTTSTEIGYDSLHISVGNNYSAQITDGTDTGLIPGETYQISVQDDTGTEIPLSKFINIPVTITLNPAGGAHFVKFIAGNDVIETRFYMDDERLGDLPSVGRNHNVQWIDSHNNSVHSDDHYEYDGDMIMHAGNLVDTRILMILAVLFIVTSLCVFLIMSSTRRAHAH